MRCHRAATDRLHIGNRWINHAGLGYYDNTARYYDALTVRFTAADLLEWKTPHLSPWAHCAGNPINFIDPSGMEIVITGGDGIRYKVVMGDGGKYVTDISTRDIYVNRTLEALNKINEVWVGRSLIDILHNDEQTINIALTKKEFENGYSRSQKTIYWDYSVYCPITELKNDGSISSNGCYPFIGLAHECFHALSDVKGFGNHSAWYYYNDNKYVDNDEKFAVIGENFIRAEHGENLRPGYFIQNENYKSEDYMGQPGLLFRSQFIGNLFKSPIVRIIFVEFIKSR